MGETTRRMWPSHGVRFCTSYFKRDVFNTWARANTDLLGDSPVMVMGERALESASRAKLPYVSYRSHLKQGWMLEYHPILDARRIDSFRALKEHGIDPHYCYKAQWRELLLNQQRRWEREDVHPHTSYAGQWDGLKYKKLEEEALDLMIEKLMYEVDEEGGPRCSCVGCFYIQAEGIRASYATPQGKPLIDRGIQIEQATGHTVHHNESFHDMLVRK